MVDASKREALRGAKLPREEAMSIRARKATKKASVCRHPIFLWFFGEQSS